MLIFLRGYGEISYRCLHYSYFLGVVAANVFYRSLTFVHPLLSLRLLRQTSIGASMITGADELKDNSPAIRLLDRTDGRAGLPREKGY